MPQPIYLDHNATTPILPEVVDAMRVCWSEPLLNPASQHEFGRRARRKLEDARERIAAMLGAKTTGSDADRVIFTSGGTESNNLALRGFLPLSLGKSGSQPEPGEGAIKGHFIISPIEHPSVPAVAENLQHEGHRVDLIPLDTSGVIRANALAGLLRPETTLVSAILGQNETGVLQPVKELAAICSEHQVPLHTDAIQVVGKLPVNFRELGVAAMSVAAHKFHGPVGIGALIVRHDIQLHPQLFGGFQQAGTRPGTESVALVVGMCRALELSCTNQESRISRMQHLRDRFESAILSGYSHAVVIGAQAERLPHTSNIAFVGINRQALFMALDQAGIACSTGSACASGSSETSPVLIAMGCDEAILKSSLRFSLGSTTSAVELDEAARRILHCCNHLRRKK